MRTWRYKYLDYTGLVVDFLNRLAKEGIQPDSIKVASGNDGYPVVFYFWDVEIK